MSIQWLNQGALRRHSPWESGPTFVPVKTKQLQVEAPPLLRGADRRHPWPSTAINLNRVAAANDYDCSALVRLPLIRKNSYC